jgi:RNA polymerase sigma factor (TIGR02999 family)
MKDPLPESVTQLLIEWGNGDRGSLDKLMPLIEEELRRIAHRHMRKEPSDHILQTTALINETYLRLVDQSCHNLQNRSHFFAVAARLMRQILVDYARVASRQKRGGGWRPLPLEEALIYAPPKSAALIALDEALTRLSALDARKTQVVELRYFGGLSVAEAACVLGVHSNTVIRDWTLAKAWLKRELEGMA